MRTLFASLRRFGVRPGLGRISKLMEALGHPENKLKVILVTGTNGKGSVTAYLASMLKEAGYKTGSYFSPHLVEYNERFRINGKPISDAKLKKYEKLVLALFGKGYEMTEFEALTAVAYGYFADEGCDFAVMEIGMGGRFDAANVAEEAISIITNVDLEHTEYLGDTLAKVAFEKAGVMKRGAAITGAKGEALGVIRAEAASHGIQLRVLDENIFAKPAEVNAKHGLFNYVGHSFLNNLEVRLLGMHQITNAALAVAAAEELGVEEEAIREGLKKAENPGRLQIIGRNPLVVLDGAHNVHGVKELIANLNLFNYEKLIVVFGVMADKDWKTMLSLLGPHADVIISNQPEGERAADAEKVAAEAKAYARALVEKDVKKSFALAKKEAGKKDMILVCGSLYMLGELLTASKSRKRPARK